MCVSCVFYLQNMQSSHQWVWFALDPGTSQSHAQHMTLMFRSGMEVAWEGSRLCTWHMEPTTMYTCNLTLLHTNMSGEVMTSSMTCPAQGSLNGTVITCGTGGGQMNQTTIRFDSCPSSPPPQPGELQIGWIKLCELWIISLLPANDSVSHTPTWAIAIGVVVCVIPVVVIGVRVLCWVKRRGRKKTHRITSQSTDKEVSYHI